MTYHPTQSEKTLKKWAQAKRAAEKFANSTAERTPKNLARLQRMRDKVTALYAQYERENAAEPASAVYYVHGHKVI